jgi:MFS family permease
MAIFMGGTPVGAPFIGWIGDVAGPRWTIGIGTVAVGLMLVAVSVWMGRRENVQVTYESRRRPRIRIRTLPQPAVSEPVPEAVR